MNKQQKHAADFNKEKHYQLNDYIFENLDKINKFLKNITHQTDSRIKELNLI